MTLPDPEMEDLLARVSAIEDLTYQRLRQNSMDMLTAARPGTGDMPQEPTVGWTPFHIAQLVAVGAIDFATLASGLFVAPVASTHAVPTKGTAASLNLSDHDHGLPKGPPLEALVVTYDGPGKPNGVVRTDTPGGAVETTVITYAGTHVASVVTTRPGYVITVVPTYSGDDITSVARTVV